MCIPFAICLAFTGCSNSEKNQEQASSSQVETTTADTEASTSTESAQADVDKSIEANITAIVPNAVLAVNDNNSLSVDLTVQELLQQAIFQRNTLEYLSVMYRKKYFQL